MCGEGTNMITCHSISPALSEIKELLVFHMSTGVC